ncbi:nitrobindin family protein [Microbacterium halophytorum]|uniref:FABP family protein n=1 Tax=Microbacterium halophytorum TaxID=2067568 RepID=UPI000CFC79D1|nr:FABP family protein [Microbacterium halophytorum]
MIEIPTDLPAEIVPLSWLLGVWEGTGMLDYTTGDSVHFEGEFEQQVSFTHTGGPFVLYSATATYETPLGTRAQLAAETGFWRLALPSSAAEVGPGLLPPTESRAPRNAEDIEKLRNARDGFDIEASIVRSDGVSELYVGQVKGPRIDLATDAVVRSAGAKDYSAATRMYGLVEEKLLWAWDIAAMGRSLSSHASAQLKKVQ